MKLVYLLQWKEDAFGVLREQHPDVEFVRATTQDEAIRELVDADVLVVGGPFYKGKLAVAANNAAPRLRWIQSISIGIDEFEKGGVPAGAVFTNAAGLKGGTVGEHAMTLLLAYMHMVPQMAKLKAERRWGREDLRHDTATLEGKTVLVLGHGSIGQEVGRKAQAFDARVIGINRSGSAAPYADEIHPIAKLTDVLGEADAVISTLPLSADTRHLMGEKQFRAMKPGAIFVNVGRGGTVDHDALKNALSSDHLGGACLDVFEDEPLAPEDTFWDMPNVLISPHIGGNGGPIQTTFTRLVGENLQRLKDGKDLINVQTVNAAAAE